jgi:hypothetical protein
MIDPTALGTKVLTRLTEIEKELADIEDRLDAAAAKRGRMPMGLYSQRDQLWDEQGALQKIVGDDV